MSDELGRLAEIKAMQGIVEVLKGLGPESVARVLRWASETYGLSAPTKTTGAKQGKDEEQSEFGSVSDFYNAVDPQNAADKALVVAYWIQFREGKESFGAQEVNTSLKNLGHGVGNITDALDVLKARKPAAVIQLKKSGTSRQARKTYKVTAAGKTAVEAMIGQE